MKFTTTTLMRAFALVLLAVGAAGGQTVEVYPPELKRVPLAGLDASPYWQQLRITFEHGVAASDSAVSILLPHGTGIPDSDGDGRWEDEIRVVYVPVGDENPGFIAATRSTAEEVVVRSVRACAAGGRLFVQFPLSVTVTPTGPEVRYRAIRFASVDEQDLEVGPSLEFVIDEEFAALASVGLLRWDEILDQAADTTTSALGEFFPSTPALLVTSPPDLVADGGQGTVSNLLPAYTEGLNDGRDDNDTAYRFYWSTDPRLSSVSEQSAIPALIAPEGQPMPYTESERGEQVVRLLTRDLQAGRYYLYAVCPVTGSLPLARSRAVVIRHDPVIRFVGPATDIVLDSGALLDAYGATTGTGQAYTDLEYRVVDFDDAARVWLFYSAADDLSVADVQVSESQVSALSGATAIPRGQELEESGEALRWDVVDPVRIDAGDYYIYAVAVDGETVALRRSAGRLLVRHSPQLCLDALNDTILAGADTLITGGERPQRYVNLTWNRAAGAGDDDVDDDARISLFLSTRPAATAAQAGDGWDLPGDAAAFLDQQGETVWCLARGLSEDVDGRAGDQFAWDLWGSYPDTPPPLTEGVIHYVYAIIEDETAQRLVQMNGGRRNDAASRLTFLHPPSVWVRQPVADIALAPGSTTRVSWDDMDLDDDARLRVVLSTTDQGVLSDYQTLIDAGAVVANMGTGTPPAAVDSVADMREDSPIDYCDITTADPPLANGTYYVYVAITDTGVFAADSRAWRAYGRIQVQGGDGSSGERPLVRLTPDVFALETPRGHQRVEVHVDAGGEAVDFVRIELSVDRSQFLVTDLDTTLSGEQPFAIGAGFSRANIVTNRVEEADGERMRLVFEYFEPTADHIGGLDGGAVLAAFELVGREVEGTGAIMLEGESEATRGARVERDGVPVAVPTTSQVGTVSLVAGCATLRGHVDLEGRDDDSAVVDVSLRPWARYTAPQDSAFSSANDMDAERPGVQVQVSADGAFELQSVPTGLLDLYVHLDGYLDAWVPGLELFATQIVEDLIPITPGADGKMLAGDVAGDTDAAGASRPDNEVTLVDWNFVASYFGTSGEGGTLAADITADGIVDIRDLALVGANFLRRGPQPVYKPPVLETVHVWLESAVVAGSVDVGQRVRVSCLASDPRGIRAAQVQLQYDAREWDMEREETPTGALTACADFAAGRCTALVMPGRQASIPETGPLVRWTLRARQTEPTWPQLGDVFLLDRTDRALPVDAHVGADGAPLPGRLRLAQNYPNPFNPRTTVPVAIPALSGAGETYVELVIFDALGQRVRMLHAGMLAAGPHAFTWDGRDDAGVVVGSGVYICRLRTGSGERLVRRMVLVR